MREAGVEVGGGDGQGDGHVRCQALRGGGSTFGQCCAAIASLLAAEGRPQTTATA